MNRYQFTVLEHRITTYEVQGESESAARQAFIEDDCKLLHSDVKLSEVEDVLFVEELS